MIEDLIQGLNSNGAAVTALATGVLVVVTGYYAWQNRRMVEEMRRARAAQVMPSLKASIDPFVPGRGTWRITNVGPGAALDVDVEMSLVPRDDAAPWSRRYVSSMMVPGEHADFLPVSLAAPGSTPTFDELGAAYATFVLRGTCADVLGTRHEVTDAIDVREWWTLLVETHRRRMPDHAADSAKALGKIAMVLEAQRRDVQYERASRLTWRERWEWRIERLRDRLRRPGSSTRR